MRRLMLVILLLAIASSSVQAQEPPAVSTFLPDTQDIGEGWSAMGQGKPDTSDTVFTDSASVSLIGPQGAELVVMLFRHPTDRGSVLTAWTQGQSIYRDATLSAVALPNPFTREVALASTPPPAGVVQAIRTEGIDMWWGMPAAVSLYAIEPDVVALVVLHGVIAMQTGSTAADYIASIIARKVVDFG